MRNLSKEQENVKDVKENKSVTLEDIKAVSTESAAEVSTLQWIIHMLAFCIPVVNMIYSVYLIFSEGTNKTTVNWAKAALLFSVFFMIVYFIICWQIASNWNNFLE